MKRFTLALIALIVILAGCGPVSVPAPTSPADDLPTGEMITNEMDVNVQPVGLEVSLPESIVTKEFLTDCCGNKIPVFFGDKAYSLTIRDEAGKLPLCDQIQRQLIWQKGRVILPCGETARWFEDGKKYQVALLDSRNGEVRRVSPWSELFEWTQPEECPEIPASEVWNPEEGPDILLALHKMTFDPRQGWVGTYYKGEFENFLGEEIYPVLDLQWEDSSPAAGVPKDGFSGTFVWKGISGTNVWHYSRDDGMRIWVGTPATPVSPGHWKLVHDSWKQGSAEGSLTFRVEEDDFIVVAFHEDCGWAHIRLTTTQ